MAPGLLYYWSMNTNRETHTVVAHENEIRNGFRTPYTLLVLDCGHKFGPAGVPIGGTIDWHICDFNAWAESVKEVR